MSSAVEVEGLTKRYGSLTAVDNVSLDIERGEIFGLLGPNGAGKTTTVEMVEGLRRPDAGTIRVCGIDTSKDGDGVKEIIGVQLQSTTIYDRIRVGEVIDLFGGYYRKRVPTSELLNVVSLNDKKNSFMHGLSGGQRQRVAMALALVNDPEVLFLDEPTTGLDPQARRNVWDIIQGLGNRGKTIILTTHYMEEAERLCGRVGIIDQGKIIALDTTKGLIANQNLESAIEFTVSGAVSAESLQGLDGVSKVSQDGDGFVLHTREASRVLGQLTSLSAQDGFGLGNISVRQATLEDVFLALTGRRLRN